MFLVQDYIAVFSIIQHLQSLPPVVSFHTHDNIKDQSLIITFFIIL